MKRLIPILLALAILPAIMYAVTPEPGTQPKPLPSRQGVALPNFRDVPQYTFTKLPTAIITNYYDYMIGSYNEIPLMVIPQSAGGGYFMTYMGRRQATSTRRVFYAYLSPEGNVLNNSEITSVQNHEGFPSMALDPVTGKPMYAWHANADADANLEVQFVSDAFMSGIPGLFNDVQVVFDAPTSVGGTTDNEFIWPCMVVGPSPVAGKRRVYVGARNYVSHAMNGSPSENMYIAYADFNGDDIEMGQPMSWSYLSIPEQDAWNHDTTALRRPSGTLAVDDAGNLYWAGHHIALDLDSNSIDEEDIDVFISPNYGQGGWTRISDYSNIPTWNPPGSPGGTQGYYTDPDNGDQPYTDAQLSWSISNSGHVNAVTDGFGRIHVPSIWALNTYNGYYYPALQFIKEFVYDPQTQEFEIREIYPQKDFMDDFNACFTPWDIEAPWGEVDEYGGDATNGYYPLMVTAWPFPHWDQTAHTDAMMFHYNGIKITEPNEQGMMACVWQDSQYARWYNYYSDTDYASYANTPEIWISVSPNSGGVWSEPIVLNNVVTPQLTGIKPMYTYPADKMIFTGMQGSNKVGKLGIMFYNDFTWGSNVNQPPYHANPDGGEVMFMELQIVFPYHASDDPAVTPMANMLLPNYPNPFNPETTISFDLPQSGRTNLSIYNVKGQLIKTLVSDELTFGRHSYVWNGKDNNNQDVSSGLYFYRLISGGHVENRKMMLMK